MEDLETTLLESIDTWGKQGLSKQQISDEVSRHLRVQSYVKPGAGSSKGGRDGGENRRRTICGIKVQIWCFVICPVVLAIAFGGAALTVDGFLDSVLDAVHGTPCIISNNALVSEMVRPHFNCDICKGLTKVDEVIDISKQDFLEKYAFTGVPVLVKNGAASWTAMDTFSFDFFKELYERHEHNRKLDRENVINEYENIEEDIEEDKYEGQFFPYKTEFSNLKEALSMPQVRAEYQPGQRPWYFGWSNCESSVQEELRRHYSRPYFLPEDTESSSIDWMFMGGHGLGAFMHIDSVDRPSWQAQITGSKTWELAPPVECEAVCNTINATMVKGDIIVVDTNQWYHATFIHPGEISITIGSEFE